MNTTKLQPLSPALSREVRRVVCFTIPEDSRFQLLAASLGEPVATTIYRCAMMGLAANEPKGVAK